MVQIAILTNENQ